MSTLNQQTFMCFFCLRGECKNCDKAYGPRHDMPALTMINGTPLCRNCVRMDIWD